MEIPAIKHDMWKEAFDHLYDDPRPHALVEQDEEGGIKLVAFVQWFGPPVARPVSKEEKVEVKKTTLKLV